MQNYFDANPNVFTETVYALEHSQTLLKNDWDTSKSWALPFNYILQQYIRLASEMAVHSTKEQLLDFYETKRDEYNEVIYRVVESFRDEIILTLRPITLTAYEESVSALSNTKVVLIIIIACSMGVAVIVYISLIRRVLNVVRYKSEVMQIFADIPAKDIRAMVEGMSRISIESMRFDPRVLYEADEASPTDTAKKAKKGGYIYSTEGGQSQVTKLKLNDEKVTHEEGAGDVKVKVAEELGRDEVQKKREILKQADQGSKRRAVLVSTAFMLTILVYYAGSIGIILIIFNGYDSLSFNLRWVSLRHSAITLEFLMLKELVITGKEELQAKADSELSNLYTYEQNIQGIKTSSMNLYSNYKKLITRLDSAEFCEVIRPRVTAEVYEQCREEGDYSMQRGMQNNIYQIMSYLNSISNRYLQYNGFMHFREILSGGGWPLASMCVCERSLY